MTADVEDEYVVAQANEPLDEGKHFVRPRVLPAAATTSWRSTPRRSIIWTFSPNDGLCCYRLHPLPGER